MGMHMTEEADEGIVNIFHQYSNTSSNLIDPEGIEKLCSDLDVSPNQMRDFTWKKKPGQPNFRVVWLKKVLETLVDVYHQYSNTASNLIDPQGTEELCSDFDIFHTDIRILMLAWKMKAKKQGYFTQEEWTRGLVVLGADTLHKLKKALPELEKEVRMQSNFADFYAYAFRYSLSKEEQESIDIETICQLLDMVMGSTFRPQVDHFVDYLKIQNDYKVINMDHWMGFYRFCNEISLPEMTEYNPELAWPLLLNNFVEWIREKTSLKA